MIDESGTITQAGPAGAVTVYRHMVYNGDLVHALDYVVLLHLLFATRESRPITPPQLWKELQAAGVRSAKNANELVGRNAVYESLGRLIAAWYVRRYEEDNKKHPGRRGAIRYEVYENPVWNPDFQATLAGTDPLEPTADSPVKPQVGTLTGTREAENGQNGQGRVSAGQNAYRNAGSGVPGYGVPGRGERRIPAGRNTSQVPGSIGGPPPHPPEEVDTSSPNPLKLAATPQEEEVRFAPEEIAAAEHFLQVLPHPWTAGRQTAKKLGRKLTEATSDQGWKLDPDLVRHLTQNPDGIKSYARVLATRIDDLPLRSAALAKSAGQSAGGLLPWCGECNRGEQPTSTAARTVELPDGRDINCPRCHPAAARSSS